MIVLGLYSSLEDKWYGFLDSLEKRNIPLYKIADFFEKRGIASFPIFLVIVLLVVLGIGYYSYNAFFQNSQVTILLTESGIGVAGETVTIEFDGQTITKTSNSSGKVEAGVPIGKTITVRLSGSQEYSGIEREYLVNDSEEEFEYVLNSLDLYFSKTVTLQDSSGKIVEDPVSVSFSCSSASYSETKVSSSGKILLENVPKNCGLLYVSIGQGFVSEADFLEPETESDSIVLVESREKGNALVSVADFEGKTLPGILVQVFTESDFKVASKFTGSTGTVKIEDIPIGTYKILAVDDSGEYVADASSLKEIVSEGTTEYVIEMRKSAIGSLKLLLKDSESGENVQGAETELFKGKVSFGIPKYSDEDGRIEFKVGENVEYNVRIDHPDYLIESQNGLFISETEKTINLVKANSVNSQGLSVRVVDEKGEGVENALVKVQKEGSGEIVGEEASGADGRVFFERIETGNYVASALKTGYGENSSQLFEVKTRQVNEVEIVLNIGTGNLEVSVLDEEKQAIAGATIQVIDVFSGQRIGQEYLGDSTGKKKIGVRADKTVIARVSAPGFLQGESVKASMSKDATKQVEVVLYKDIAKLEVEFLGLYKEGLEVSDSVSAGEKYVAKLRLKVPQGSNYSELGVHLRTGSEDSSSMEEDYLYLKKVSASADSVIKGTSYNPPNNFSIDSMHLVKEDSDAKWTEFKWSNPESRTFEIEAEVQVRDEAVRGSALEIQYRAYGKSGGIVRFPSDAELGQAESTGTKQSLYAKTNTKIYSVGASTLCSDNFCSVVEITDESSGIKTGIANSYTAKSNQKYTLSFLTAYTGGTTKSNAVLRVESPESAVSIDSYDITAVSGSPAGSPDTSEFEVPIGSLGQDSSVSGTVEFTTQKEGESRIELSIVSGNEKLYSKTIELSVEESKELSVSIIPKTLVPYISNNLIVTVLNSEDNSAVSNASATIYLNEELLGTVYTKSNGTASYTLNSPANNSLLKIVVEKQGFKKTTIEQQISEQIVSFEPLEITQNLAINGPQQVERSLQIKNETEIDLTIRRIQASKFEGLVVAKLDRDLTGQKIAKDENIDALISLSLTSKGKQLNESKTVKGAIEVVAENPDFSSWLARIPIEVGIGFGEQVDDLKCLTVEPNEWNLYTSNDSKTLEVVVRNNCAVEGEKVALRSLEAKIYQGNENSIGTFTASGRNATIGLGTGFKQIQEFVEEGESLVTLSFEPSDIKAGTASPKIVFHAINRASTENQEILAELKVNANVNNLSECVNIKAENLVVETSPFNTGYNYYGTSNPYNAYGSQNYYYSQLNSYYPYSGYQNQYINPYANSTAQQNISWPSSSSFFTVENTCSSDIEVSLDPSNSLIVSKQDFSLGKGKTTKVDLEAGYRIGVFKILLSAKVKDSEDSLEDIKALNVLVQSASEVNKDCIQLDTTSLSFTDFLGRPVKAKIYNNCYDSGVRLSENAGDIQIQELSYPITQQYRPPSYTGLQPFSPFDQGYQAFPGDSRMYSGVRTFPTYLTSGGKYGGNREVLEFEVIRDLSYKENAPDLLTQGTTFAQLGSIRYFLASGYYSANSQANLTVTYNTPYGGSQRKLFPIVLKDSWSLGEFLEKLASGNPKIPSQDCIKPIDITATDYWFGGPNIMVGSETVKVLIVDKEHCSYTDSLDNLLFFPNEAELFGAKISVALVGRDSVKVTIDRTNMKRESVTSTRKMQAKLTRFNPPGTQTVDIQSTIRIYGREVIPTEQPTALSCINGSGEKGANALPKVKFEWRYMEIGEKFCTSGETYCDGTQHAITLFKKDEKVKALVDAVKNTAEGKASFLEGDKDLSKSIEELKNSEELYRFVTKQVKVRDDVLQKDLVFFLGKDGLILNNPLDEEAKKAVEDLTGAFVENETNSETVSKTQNLLDSVKGKDYSQNIVAEVTKWWQDGDTHDGFRKAIGIDSPTASSGTSYEKFVLTFEEFYKMHKAIKETCADTDELCDIKVGNNQTIKITASFLAELKKNITFKVGIRNKDFLSKKEIDKLLEDGARNGIPSSSTLTKGFYYENIKFTSYLITDKYSSDFKSDFTAKYSKSISSWTFSPEAVSEPGDYNVTIKHKWNGEVEIAIKKTENFKKPEKQSVFYYLPFDGLLGSNAGGRNEYGIVFSSAGEKIRITSFEKDGTYNNSDLTIGTGYQGTKLSTTYSNSFIGVNNLGDETVLKISKSAINYRPTTQVAVDIEIRPTTQSPGLEFALNTGGQQSYSASEKVFSNEIQGSIQQISSTLSNTRYITQNSESTIYTPIENASSLVMDTRYTTIITKAEANAKYVNGTTKQNNAGSGSSNLRLAEEESNPTLQELFDNISGEKGLCIKQSDTEATIYWEEN